MSGGKKLYSQIFFNHQPLMAYFSLLVQQITHPQNIYELILRHRQFMFLVAFVMDFLIIYRFGLRGVGFALFFEFSKFYIFGDRFLAEGIVIYFLVYLLGIVWEKINGKKLSLIDYLSSAVFTVLILALREPYILVSILMYIAILFGKDQRKYKTSSFFIFAFLTLMVLLFTPIKEYLFQVVEVNKKIFLENSPDKEQFYIRGLKMIFYPIYLYFDGIWNLFRIFLVGLDSIFLIEMVLFIKFFKKIKIILMVVLFLALANSYPPPGLIFYASFHLVPWYGMFIFLIFLILSEIFKINKKLSFSLIFFLMVLLSYLLLSPNSYTKDRVDPHYEFITNYGNTLQIGEVVKVLSKPNSTLFLDGSEDLIYWQSKLMSPYKYSWYTSFMPSFPIFVQAREEMFKYNPPDFYYAFCSKDGSISSIPKKQSSKYQQLYSFGKPTCLFMKRSLISEISQDQWKRAKEFKYELPESKKL